MDLGAIDLKMSTRCLVHFLRVIFRRIVLLFGDLCNYSAICVIIRRIGLFPKTVLHDQNYCSSTYRYCTRVFVQINLMGLQQQKRSEPITQHLLLKVLSNGDLNYFRLLGSLRQQGLFTAASFHLLEHFTQITKDLFLSVKITAVCSMQGATR